MAISPLGNTIFINQNTPAIAAKQGDFQSRLDAQNLAASQLYNDENDEVNEIRPTEEIYKIDPKNEQEKNRQREQNKKQNKDDNNENENVLDIKI